MPGSQIRAFRPQTQAGSLCYHASALDPLLSVADFKHHRIRDLEMAVIPVHHSPIQYNSPRTLRLCERKNANAAMPVYQMVPFRSSDV